MGWSAVTIERTPPVAVVRFDRRTRLNAFDRELVRELTEAARTFENDLETQAIVLAGAADAFSAGADLKDAASWPVEEGTDVERRHRFYAGVRLCRAWEELPQITIAAMERMAVGAGVAMALACDWRVLGRGAYLYVPEVHVGLNLQWGALPRLVTLVGPARAKRITLLCEKMDAATALAWGLVDALADDGHTVETALALARRTAEMPAGTVRLLKEAVNATAGALHRATSYADADQSQLTASFDAARAARRRFGQR